MPILYWMPISPKVLLIRIVNHFPQNRQSWQHWQDVSYVNYGNDYYGGTSNEWEFMLKSNQRQMILHDKSIDRYDV